MSSSEFTTRSFQLRLDDDPSHQYVNSWLDRLASPAVILAATNAAALIIAVIRNSFLLVTSL